MGRKAVHPRQRRLRRVLILLAAVLVVSAVVVDRASSNYRGEREALSQRIIENERRSIELRELHFRELFTLAVEADNTDSSDALRRFGFDSVQTSLGGGEIGAPDTTEPITGARRMRDGEPVYVLTSVRTNSAGAVSTISAIIPYSRVLEKDHDVRNRDYEMVMQNQTAELDAWYAAGVREAIDNQESRVLVEGTANATEVLVALRLWDDSEDSPFVLFRENSAAFERLMARRAEHITIGMLTLLGVVIIILVLGEAHDKALEASSMKSLFLANVSHELRTPMNGVVGMISALEAPDLSSSKRSEYLRLLRKSSDALMHLLNSILEMSRLEAEKVEITPVAFDLHALVQDTVAQTSAWEIAHHLELRVEIDEQVPQFVTADEARIRQILTNCVHNALKFTREGGVTVRVRNGAGEKRIALSITDTGVGIEPDDLKSIFEKFNQVNTVAARRHGGSGLGLSIVDGLVSLLHGEIAVESIPGVGTTFTITLPVAAASEDAIRERTERERISGPLPETRHALHILLAEDDSVNALVTSEILRKQGWTVEHAATGVEAVELGSDGNFDLILMDRMMPEMDGLAATRELIARWKQAGIASTPIVGLSAAVAPEDQMLCRQAGMDGFLTKPTSAEALTHTVAHAVQTGPPIDLTIAESSFDSDTELVDEVLPIFIEQAKERLKEIRAGVEEHDANRIERQTHPLKTSSRYLGAQRLGTLAAKMDSLSRSPDDPPWNEMELLAQSIAEELNRIEQWAGKSRQKGSA
jgi:signal transduction histidine kinase/CheY-like chemotaxis protein